ncbi:Delta-1-pyrroline-5-carboxylate dehydrogenase [Fusarium oxysporum f. sp. albedinis]|nr:Delta-1-pyrroline-5-carboxylate dehydrogenase [Fusarium oxysporum f. sp. albedinis]
MYGWAATEDLNGIGISESSGSFWSIINWYTICVIKGRVKIFLVPAENCGPRDTKLKHLPYCSLGRNLHSFE